MKNKMKSYYMKLAEETAKLSYSRNLKVGAIIVKDNRIISNGYNRNFSDDDNCEDEVSVNDITEFTQLTNLISQKDIRVFDGSVFETGNGTSYIIRLKIGEELENAQRSPFWQISSPIKFFKLIEKPEVCSATITALSRLIRSRESSVDADLYLTHTPSLECAKNIILAGINTVYYKHKYRTSKGIDLLMDKGILVKQIPDGE